MDIHYLLLSQPCGPHPDGKNNGNGNHEELLRLRGIVFLLLDSPRIGITANSSSSGICYPFAIDKDIMLPSPPPSSVRRRRQCTTFTAAAAVDDDSIGIILNDTEQ